MTRSQLVSLGLPTRKGKSSKAKKAKKAKDENNLSEKTGWMNRQVHALRSQHGQISRAHYKDVCQDLGAKWDRGDRAEIWAGTADDDVGIGTGVATGKESVYIAPSSLWGTSSLESVVRPDVLVEELGAWSKPQYVTKHGFRRSLGFTDRLQPIRRAWVESLFIKDLGAIPAARKFKYETLCGHKHPGLCVCDITPTVELLHSSMLLRVAGLPVGEVFSIARISGDETEEELAFMNGTMYAGAFVCCRLLLSGPYDKRAPRFACTSWGGWDMCTSYDLARQISPQHGALVQNPPVIVVLKRFKLKADVSNLDEACTVLPPALETSAVSAEHQLFPVSNQPVTKPGAAVKSSHKAFHDLLMKGFPRIPMSSVYDDGAGDDHGSDGEDEVAVQELEAAMAKALARRRRQIVKGKLRATGRKMTGRAKRPRDAVDPPADVAADPPVVVAASPGDAADPPAAPAVSVLGDDAPDDAPPAWLVGRGNYQVLAVPGGWLSFSAVQKTCDAHCRRHSIKQSKCKMDRSLKKGNIGLSLAWLAR